MHCFRKNVFRYVCSYTTLFLQIYYYCCLAIMWWTCLMLFVWPTSSLCDINLYIEDDQVYRLLGIEDAQLFYIRDGVVNHNALNFVAHVQPRHEKLEYIWYTSSSDIRVLYDAEVSIQTSTSDECSGDQCNAIIKAPTISPKQQGVVTSARSTFVVTLACTGQYEGNVTVYTNLTLKIPTDESSEVVLVTIKRLKKCVKTHNSVWSSTQHPPASGSPSTTLGKGALSSHTSTSVFYISISVITGVILTIIATVVMCHLRATKRQAALGNEASHAAHAGPSNMNQFLRPDLPNNAQKPPSHTSLIQFAPLINDLGRDISEVRGQLTDIAISRSALNLDDLFMEGTFARVHRGTLDDGTPILAKTVTDAATEEQKRLLLFEGSMFRSVQHRNLMSVKHVVLGDDSSPPAVVFPFANGKNLKHYLQHCKASDASCLFAPSSEKYESASTQDLVNMSVQIACGMTYLSKRKVVHKDLATRNCVIDDDMIVKITDNALSRDVFPLDYSCLADKENRPIRWLALESLIHKFFSSASDVWSFGIVLWELQSLAARPYNEIDDFEMAEYLTDGFRLSQPVNCPDHLYNIMAGCWHYSPVKRPKFTQLLQMLTEFDAELGDYV